MGLSAGAAVQWQRLAVPVVLNRTIDQERVDKGVRVTVRRAARLPGASKGRLERRKSQPGLKGPGLRLVNKRTSRTRTSDRGPCSKGGWPSQAAVSPSAEGRGRGWCGPGMASWTPKPPRCSITGHGAKAGEPPKGVVGFTSSTRSGADAACGEIVAAPKERRRTRNAGHRLRSGPSSEEVQRAGSREGRPRLVVNRLADPVSRRHQRGARTVGHHRWKSPTGVEAARPADVAVQAGWSWVGRVALHGLSETLKTRPSRTAFNRGPRGKRAGAGRRGAKAGRSTCRHGPPWVPRSRALLAFGDKLVQRP